MSIGSRIKQIRKEVEMTQGQFAEAIGMKQSPLSQIESDRILPSIETLRVIIRKFNTTYEFVLDGNNNESELLILPEGVSKEDYRKLGINSRSLVSQLVKVINSSKDNENSKLKIDSILELESFVQDVVDERIGKLEDLMGKLLNSVDRKIFEDDMEQEITKSNQRLKKENKPVGN